MERGCMINIIVAMGMNNEIGKHNNLLCKLGDDMRLFRMITEGHIVVMGRKTFDSIRKPLPNRMNVVLTNDSKYHVPEEVATINGIEPLLLLSKEREIFIIGGGEVYKQFLPYADSLYITKIHYSFDDADAFFPEYDTVGWRIVTEMNFPKNDRNEYPFTFTYYERV